MQELSYTFMIPTHPVSQSTPNEKSDETSKRKSEFLEGKLRVIQTLKFYPIL